MMGINKVFLWLMVGLSVTACHPDIHESHPTQMKTMGIRLGNKVSSEFYDDAVRIHYKSSTSLRNCSGVLVSPTIVLTTAHCVQGKEKDRFFIQIKNKNQLEKPYNPSIMVKTHCMNI